MRSTISVMQKKYHWQKSLTDLITDPKELFNLLDLDHRLLPMAYQATEMFPLKVTRQFVTRMQKGNPKDPLLLQVLPLGFELDQHSGYVFDPLKELKMNPLPGLLHKYHGRVLVTLTGACAVHCRYCFRRNFPYEENNPGKMGWKKIIHYIKQDETIHEVILSGGDPLSASDALLQAFTDQLKEVPHVKRLRIHTRLPIVLPERITTSLIHWISNLHLKAIVVVHVNHPQEINQEVSDALNLLCEAKILLLNQTVLLKDINDQAETLISLSETLFASSVLPYYLHVLDKVHGACHFDIPLDKAHALHQSLSHHLPGYLVPKLVREDPGEPAKTLI